MPASWRSRICSGRYGVTEPTHSPESLNRFGRSAKYLARTFRFPPSDMQDAAQEALIRAWQAPPDKPLAYYEVAMRRRLIDHQKGALFGTTRTNNGGRGPRRVQSVRPLDSLVESEEPGLRDTYPSDSDLSWAYEQVRNLVDKEMLDDVVSGRTEQRGPWLFPDRHQKQWPEFKRHLKEAYNDDTSRGTDDGNSHRDPNRARA